MGITGAERRAGGDWQLPSSRVPGAAGRGGRSGLLLAPRTPRLTPGAVFVPTRGLGRLAPSLPRAGLAGRGGALPAPGPRGPASVSKVTLRCLAEAAAAGAISPPRLPLRSGSGSRSGSSRPGGTPERTTQHPDTHRGPPPRAREDPSRLSQAQRPASRSSRCRRNPGVGKDARDPALPSLHVRFPGPRRKGDEL